MIAETNRLLIRKLTQDDAEFVLRLTTEPSVMAGIGDKGVRTLDDARAFIRDGFWTNQPKPGHGQFAVVLKTQMLPVGVCGILYRARLELSDIGFAFLSAHRGCGYAFEAAGAMMEYGRTVLGLTAIVGLTSSHNKASSKVLEKLGLRFQNMLKTSDDDPGTCLYG